MLKRSLNITFRCSKLSSKFQIYIFLEDVKSKDVINIKYVNTVQLKTFFYIRNKIYLQELSLKSAVETKFENVEIRKLLFGKKL